EILRGKEPATAKQRRWMDMVEGLENAEDTMELIKVTDQLYNEIADPYFERQHGNLEQVLAVTLEDLAEFSWKDYLNEEALNNDLETYLNKVTENMIHLDQVETGEDQENTEKERSEEHTS